MVKNLKIAFIPIQQLGDGVISLILANNLYQNNYSVTMFHNFMHQINDWFEFDIAPHPNHEEIENVLDEYDIVLIDMGTPYVLEKNDRQKIELSKKYICISYGRLPDLFSHDHTKRLINNIGAEKRRLLIIFAKASRTIKYNKSNSMVENVTHYCQHTLQLTNVTNRPEVNIADKLIFRKYHKRVVIAPTSGLKKKNWDAKKFLFLARKLTQLGYEPVISVTPNEWQQWNQIINNEFELPKFHTIKLYSEYLYESLCFIGNDSGGGHLASLMGIPVLTIVTSPKKLNFRWRPGWGDKNIIIAPVFSFKLMGKRYWQAFLSVNRVFMAFKRLIN